MGRARLGRALVGQRLRAGVVRIDIDPPVRVVAIGFPVRLRTLWIALDDPDGFLAVLGRARSAGPR